MSERYEITVKSYGHDITLQVEICYSPAIKETREEPGNPASHDWTCYRAGRDITGDMTPEETDAVEAEVEKIIESELSAVGEDEAERRAEQRRYGDY